MEVRTTLDIDGPAATTTWQVFGEDFGNVSEWSAGFVSSSLDGPVAQGAMRTVELKAGGPVAGSITQEITEFDRASRTLTYEMRTGMPGFIHAVQNRWTIEELDAGHSRIGGRATFQFAWWTLPLRPLLRIKMSKTLTAFAAELAAHVVKSARAA